MSRIIISDLNFSYKEYYQPIFNHVNISIDTDWRLGLIGRNGRGKTTFLRLLHGDLEPDRGTIMKDAAVELFPYEITTEYTNTLDVMKEYIGFLKSMEDQMDSLITAKNEEAKIDASDMEEYQRILSEYLELDGFSIESKIKKEMNLMKLPERLLEQEYELLSGGEKTKMQIIALFLRKNAFVLLDEPTNHLDLEGKRVLAEYLQRKRGFLAVSHDRSFLDEVVDHVLSINKADIAIEKGNYSSWRKNKEMAEEYEFRTKAKLEREVEALEKVSVRTRNWAAVAEKEKNPYATHNRGNGTRAAKFMRQAKTAEHNIQDNLKEKKNLLKNFEVTPELILKQQVARAECLVSAYDLSFGYSKELLFEKLSFNIQKGERIWIRGRNGAGKSTLLKIIGRKILNSRVQYAEGLVVETAFQEPLWTEGLLSDLINDADIRSRFIEVCHRLDLRYDLLQKPLETFSSGELKKIDLARALAAPNQLLLLDEPLNFMDIYFREQLEKAILAFQPTIIFVEHDELFGNNVATGVICL
jgi:lincosamide and streptogramin A transport system ATP-binding/permease protein